MNKKVKYRKSLLNNPWIVGTGTSILAVIGLRILDKILGTNILRSIIHPIGSFFQIKFEISLWFFILMIIATAVLTIVVLWILLTTGNSASENKEIKPSFLNYKEDIFGGVLYRWDYIQNLWNQYEVIRISHYCPNCKCSIIINQCPVCHKSYFEIKPDYEIDALIRHKIETQIMVKS